MEFKISKEQIVAIEKVGGAEVSVYLRNNYPEAFIPEITEGKWYVNESGSIQFNEKGGVGYGISSIHGWTDGARWLIGNWNGKFVEATHEEVKAALGKEIIKRFGEDWEYAKIERCLYHKESRPNMFTPLIDIKSNRIWNRNGCIFNKGEWAEILPTEKTVIPREKALKILAKKLKVSPENIEIK